MFSLQYLQMGDTLLQLQDVSQTYARKGFQVRVVFTMYTYYSS